MRKLHLGEYNSVQREKTTHKSYVTEPDWTPCWTELNEIYVIAQLSCNALDSHQYLYPYIKLIIAAAMNLIIIYPILKESNYLYRITYHRVTCGNTPFF